jgi:hypothetical protein
MSFKNFFEVLTTKIKRIWMLYWVTAGTKPGNPYIMGKVKYI